MRNGYIENRMNRPRKTAAPPRHGVARTLSKLGLGSRTQAAQWVRDGRVRVNGRIVRDPEFPVCHGIDRVSLDDETPVRAERQVIMLNKPRGLVTTARDERGRDTVYQCLAGADLPWLAPVGRLDKASEGLLLFSNDPAWAASITDPLTGPVKTYHVQINRIPDDSLLTLLTRGIDCDGELLSAKTALTLRTGERNAWLEIVLSEGRNRQIRRLLSALDIAVLRLMRVAVGPLQLGDLPKGRWREVSLQEVSDLAPLSSRTQARQPLRSGLI
jgi:23S rRNA pseudouridine2605 synthase